ncbi:hypothetical protein ACH4NT_00410 [Streptomyces lydicus]|uniref:hypothetical protein n=1 Tax=Streptomyces lydicus TaxID=47763 RepID=UPI0037A952B1
MPYVRRGVGTCEGLSVTLVEAGGVVEVRGDTAVDAGRWRGFVLGLRPRTGMIPQDVALFGPREELGAQTWSGAFVTTNGSAFPP